MMSHEIEQQLKFENAFQKVLINLATRFINYPVDQMDHAITESLHQIVEFLGGLRASIYQVNEERSDLSLLYHWVALDNPRVFQATLPVTHQSPTISILKQGGVAVIPNRADMPADDPLKQIFADFGANSGVIVPILQHGKLLAIVSTSWGEPREIRSEINDLLRVVGEIFLNALDRKAAEDRMRELNETLEARVSEQTSDLLSANEQLKNEIAERKHVEGALRTSEERYRIITEIITDDAYLCHVEADNTLRIEWINQDSYVRLTGYEAEEVPQHFQTYHPEDRELARQDVEQTLQGHLTEREYRIIAKDGALHWVYTRRYPVWDDPQKRVMQFYGVAQDITERKRAEESLRVNEERYRTITELMSDYAFQYAVEPDGTFNLEWITGDSFTRLTGYSVEEARSEAFRRYHPEDAARARRDVELTIQGQSTAGEYRLYTKNGELIWQSMRRYPVWDADHNRVVRFYGVAQDITERKQIEAEEHEQRILAEALLDTADALNSTLDLEDIFDRILTNIERVAPHDASTIMLIESGRARVVRAKGGKAADWRAAIENTIYPLATTPNLRHIYETGQPLIIPDVQQYPSWVDVPINDWIRSHFCIPLQQGEAVIGFLSCESATPGFFSPKMFRQLQAFAHQTANAITNARLYQQGQELAVLQERQRLARDLHDAVTQTMFSTSMIAETMLRVLDTEPEQVRQGLTQLRYMTRGAVAEMRSLLYELRPEALESMSLTKLITQVAEAFSGKSGVIPTVSITGDRSLPQDIKITLYRIVQEALNNISKHARASAVNISLSSDAVVELTISDNGRGFTPELAKSGSLGLTIMRERVEKIGGVLTMQSEPTNGTTVRVEWAG